MPFNGLLLALSSAQHLTVLDLSYFAHSEAWRERGIRGLHVGSGLGLPWNALNTDIEGIAAVTGGRSCAETPFVAIDVAGEPRRYFLQHDARHPFPLVNASFDWVFAEHFLEHIPRRSALEFLREARRLVKGVIRLSMPDLALYARGYDADFFTRHFEVMTTGAMAGKNEHMRGTRAALFNDLFRSFGHEYIYDFDEVARLVSESQIDCKVERAAYGRSNHIPDIARSLDNPLREHESLYVDLICE